MLHLEHHCGRTKQEQKTKVGLAVVHSSHRFGGGWTEAKLDKVRQYLTSYNVALKNQPFTRLYIDAFAGTGYRTSKTDTSSRRDLFGVPQVNEFAKGSAQVALEIDPAFDSYAFIEMNRNRLAELKQLELQYPDKADRMSFIRADANEAISKICATTDWQRTRAVAFLDPYGMQVDWSTIERIASTRAIDLWYLFPSGIGLNRLLTRSGRISPSWQARLDRMLGYQGWRDVFYVSSAQEPLFSDSPTLQKVYDDERAERFILGRLEKLFAGVAQAALPLRNSKGQCMYHLVFACGNPRGAKVALRIAQHIITH